MLFTDDDTPKPFKCAASNRGGLKHASQLITLTRPSHCSHSHCRTWPRSASKNFFDLKCCHSLSWKLKKVWYPWTVTYNIRQQRQNNMEQNLNAIITTSVISFLPEWDIIKRVLNFNKKNSTSFLLKTTCRRLKFVWYGLVHGYTLAETCSHST